MQKNQRNLKFSFLPQLPKTSRNDNEEKLELARIHWNGEPTVAISRSTDEGCTTAYHGVQLSDCERRQGQPKLTRICRFQL